MDSEKPTQSSGSESMDPKLASLLSYLFSIVGGIVFYVISKDKFVRFHAMQSILLGVVCMAFYFIVMFVPILWFFVWIVQLGFLALTIILMIKAYGGEKYKLPVIGDFAEKNA